jgi:tRNA nucleotidyltransferase (CCA-adding enzyme)
MAKITPPKYVRQVLVTLQGRGYPAYLVGGCVRDMLLGVQPHDWDICTAARPEQILELFPGSRLTGGQHGTVTVRVNSHEAEVTPFRTEGDYSDHRHPDRVQFVVDLTADLSRRDFTVNAMALSADGLVSDPFGGASDLRRGVIRCVGEPERRFEEDALRMLRALRFSAKLGFSIELFTMEAIREKASLCAGLPPERVREELEKILLSPAPDTALEAVELGLLDSYLHRRLPLPIREWLSALPRRATERWTGFAWLLERGGCVASAESFLQALRLDGRTLHLAGRAAALLSGPLPETAADWKRCLRRSGVEGTRCFAACADAFRGGGCSRALKAVLKSGECYSLRDLAVRGDDLTALGLQGRAVGEMLDFLLDYVIDYPANNRRELLLSLAGGSEE